MSVNRYIYLAVLFYILLFTVTSISQTLSGNVVSVADGDTITILTQGNKQVKIRLYGIDTPEGRQAFGKKAKKFTSSLVYRKQVEVNPYDIDKYGRTVGVVVANGINVNEEIIRAGYGWQYRKYCKESFCSNWIDLENAARVSKIGLWHDNYPIPPWEWRKRNRSPVSPEKAVTEGKYHGNIKSHVFHAPGCQHYDCKNCIKGFDSIDEAVSAGYRPHKQCVY